MLNTLNIHLAIMTALHESHAALRDINDNNQRNKHNNSQALLINAQIKRERKDALRLQHIVQ